RKGVAEAAPDNEVPHRQQRLQRQSTSPVIGSPLSLKIGDGAWLRRRKATSLAFQQIRPVFKSGNSGIPRRTRPRVSNANPTERLRSCASRDACRLRGTTTQL